MASSYRPKSKQWEDIKAESSWRIFRIMSEFVDGFETLNHIGPCVSIFGSARTKPDNPYYQMAVDLAAALVDAGYGIITGGGPGIMEAGNKGAQERKGKSVGLGITLPHESKCNDFVNPDKLINLKYFFVRKVMFVKYAQAFVFMPGGFGTLDELFECLTLTQTGRIMNVPVVMMGVDYWKGLMAWMEETMLHAEHNIGSKDLDLMFITDDVEAAVQHINDFYKEGLGELQPNF